MSPDEARARAAERKAKRREKSKLIGKMAGIKRVPPRKTLIAQLDHLFSLFIRRRDRIVYAGLCVICKKRPIEHCFHWITRGSYATRWDPENACGSCGGCNYEETFRPLKFRDIHIEMIGKEKREALEAKARQRVGHSSVDLMQMRDEMKRLVEGR